MRRFMARFGRRLWLKLIPLVAVVALQFVTSQPALAWTHRINNWDSNPNDYTCGYNSSVPCLYYPEPNHVSTSVYAYLDPSLANVGGYNFDTAVTRALNDFNNVPAFNPYMYACYNAQCGAATSYSIGDLGYGVYGMTPYGYYGSVQYASGQYYAIMTGNYTIFNSANEIAWNNSLVFSATQADGRKVATHETGHFQGLGHTGHSPAVMRQGAVTYYALQPDDINGLESFYTGYIPA